MKLLIVALFSLVSSVAMADGYRCQGDELRVKIYNEVHPSRGTKNAAALVVSHRKHGTIAVLTGQEIYKNHGERAVSYEGRTNSRLDGRFIALKFEVSKKPKADGALAGLFPARLTLNADGDSQQSRMVCSRYLKSDRELR